MEMQQKEVENVNKRNWVNISVYYYHTYIHVGTSMITRNMHKFARNFTES